MATAYTREWIQFFTGCGIPDDVAAMYALIFCENRIQKNMLLDLNKEYLRDMGITVMGDVIAILRHAKIIHEKYIRDKILLVEDKISVEQNIVSNSSLEPKKSTPMKRMLERYTRKFNSEESEPVSNVQIVVDNDPISPVRKKVSDKIGNQIPLKQKIQLSTKPVKEIGLEVPVPKVRRVLPENEGGYKIKMPSGSTERSKKLLEQAKKRKIKTVFDRLGESSVSSTTSEISSSPSSSSINNLRTQSVFSRLGEKTPVVSSTSFDESTNIAEEQLPYAGILKAGVNKKFVPNTTMRADEQEKSDVRNLNLKKGVSVKKRLGVVKESSETNSSSRPILKAARTLNSKKGELISKNSTIKLTNKVNSNNVGVRNKISSGKVNNFKEESSQGKVVVSTTTKIVNKNTNNLKRKLEINSSTESNLSGSSKKVRFGKTTHRLIPPAQNSTEPTSYVKNYPKLTMIINNRVSTGVKAGSLNSDNLMRPKLGVKDRIGSKPVQDRLGKRVGIQGLKRGSEKIKRVHDRLG